MQAACQSSSSGDAPVELGHGGRFPGYSARASASTLALGMRAACAIGHITGLSEVDNVTLRRSLNPVGTCFARITGSKPRGALWSYFVLPILPQSPLITDHRGRTLVREYASRLQAQSWFEQDNSLVKLATTELVDAPCLVLDDFTDVALFPANGLFLEQRGRLRAMPGDLLVTATPIDEAFEAYVKRDLGLGGVQWLQAPAAANSIKLAQACWQDRAVRREIVHAVRAGGLRYVHPHMGNHDVWRMAQLIADAAHCPLQVIAPPPVVAHWANDKVAFAQAVADLLGRSFVPEHLSAYGFAFLSQRVQELRKRTVIWV